MIFLAIFFDLVGFGMTFPDLQLRAQDFGAPGWLIGTVLATYSVVQMAASPAWGLLSDRIGRKPALIACTVLSAVSMVLYALAGNVAGIWVSRVAAGLGAANVAIAQAYIADTTPGERRAAALGKMSAAVSGGLLFGPVIGGWLAEAGGNYLVGMSAASASALGLLCILAAAPGKPTAPKDENPLAKTSRTALLRDFPALKRLFLVAFVGWFALACLEGTFGRLIQHNLGFGRIEFGMLLSFEALVALVVQGVLFTAIERRLPGRPLLRAGYLLQAAGLILMPFAPGLGLLFFAGLLYGLGVGASNPAINGLASVAVSPARQGELFGLLQSSRAFGFMAGPVIGGIMFDWVPASPYLAAGLALALAAILAAKD